MNCAHKLVITDPNIIGSWFNKLAPAHRNPGGALYEFNLTTVISNIPNMPATTIAAIKDSAFLISKLESNRVEGSNEYYLTIIDRKFSPQINSLRWIPEPSNSGYWRNNARMPANYKLHQYVENLNSVIVSTGYDIHHVNFFTFDNRTDNLRVLTDSEHGAIDESFITPREEIKDDQDMIDFIKTTASIGEAIIFCNHVSKADNSGNYFKK